MFCWNPVNDTKWLCTVFVELKVNEEPVEVYQLQFTGQPRNVDTSHLKKCLIHHYIQHNHVNTSSDPKPV